MVDQSARSAEERHDLEARRGWRPHHRPYLDKKTRPGGAGAWDA
jgi:hypothetical protein